MTMLALASLLSCRVQAPSKSCATVMLGACIERLDPPALAAPCERGRARRLDQEACATTRETRDLARALGIFVDEHDTIECEAKTDELVADVRRGKIGCVSGGRSPPPACPPRTVREVDGGRCTPLEVRGVVDLARWTRAAAIEACARASRGPVALATPEAELEIEVTAAVADNDPTQGFVRLGIRRGPRVDPQDLEHIGRSLDDALRRLGGTASSSEASATASCRVSQRRPISVP
jgi:hypothetical protein